MTKANLIEALKDYSDDTPILVEVTSRTFDHPHFENLIVAPNDFREYDEGEFIQDDIQEHQDSFPAFTITSTDENFYKR